jgi:hypothetical protein
MIMNQAYPEPSAGLLYYGDPNRLTNSQDPHSWPDYVKTFALTLNDLPHLIRMLNDSDLQELDSNDPRVWADLHAWRAIGQLKGVDAIGDLLKCLDYEDEDGISDWNLEEIPRVLGKIGRPAVDPLSQYLEDKTKGCWSLVAAAAGLVWITKENPELRNLCIEVITRRLERYVENESNLNGFLIGSLLNLKAIESLDVIKSAFQDNAVDLEILGDLEDVEIELGIRQTTSKHRPHFHASGEICYADHYDESVWENDFFPFQPKPKIGRNEVCPCGSGKKYKHCCLK